MFIVTEYAALSRVGIHIFLIIFLKKIELYAF